MSSLATTYSRRRGWQRRAVTTGMVQGGLTAGQAYDLQPKDATRAEA